MKEYKTPVKASKLIAALKKTSYKAKIVDYGDLCPVMGSVKVIIDDDTHVCSLRGYYGYPEASVHDSVSAGMSEVIVLGVSFSKNILCSRECPIEISGRSIVYDKGLNKNDVKRAADDAISFVDYDPDDFPFDEDEVSDSDIISNLEHDCSIFALDSFGDVCGFNSKKEAKEFDCRVIDTDKAYDILAKERPHLTFEEWY